MTINFQISVEPKLFAVLQSIASSLANEGTTLTEIKQGVTNMTKEMQALKDEVAASITVQQSAITFIAGIEQQLAAAGTDPVALANLTSDLKAERDSLAAAIVATPPPTPEPLP